MAIRTLNYLDIPSKIRKQKATAQRGRLMGTLTDPLASQVTKDKATARLAKINQWERGTLGQPPVEDPYATPPSDEV